MIKLTFLEKVFWVALICLVVSTASAASWVLGNHLIYHVKDPNAFAISMIGSPLEGDISLNTEINFTITLLYGGNPVNGAIVCLFDGEEFLLSGTTNEYGICVLAYNVTEARDYDFTPRYLAP